VIEALTAQAQAAARAIMLDTCLVRRLTGTATDASTGAVTPTYATVYSGACRFQQRSQSSASPHQTGPEPQFLAEMELHLPAGTTGLDSDDLVTAVTSQDPDLLGRQWHVRQTAHKTFVSAHRYSLSEVTG